MLALTAEAARSLDARTIAAGTPGLVLMERAASAVANEIARVVAARPALAARIVVLAGTGNNGGDGFEIARLLAGRRDSGPPEIVLVGEEAALRGDARATFSRARVAGLAVTPASDGGLESLRRATLVVDALFGTGLSRPVDAASVAAAAISAAASSGAFVVAVDVASGLGAGATESLGPHLRADVTVTFGHPKTVHVRGDSAAASGRLVVARIGLLPLSDVPPGSEAVVTAPDVATWFPPRAADSHKGTLGRVGLLAGSAGMSGAAILAARGAHRAGAGLVTVLADDDSRAAIPAASPETLTLPRGAALEALASFDALGVGPGLGASAEARASFEHAVSAGVPAVFDADALNLAAGPEAFASRTAATVLTPHPGEAGRLLGLPAAAIQRDRAAAARELAERARCAVVLKGHRSLVAAPGVDVRVVLSGNPALATGGTGDVLTGIAAAFLARGLDALAAASAAAYLHGLAGDFVREARGEEGLVARDLADALSHAFRALRTAGA